MKRRTEETNMQGYAVSRTLFSCPELDVDDLSTFPPADSLIMKLMGERVFGCQLEAYAFPFVRRTSNNKPFVDIYVWQLSEGDRHCDRFVIYEGFRLPKEKEEKLVELIQQNQMNVDDDLMQQLDTDVIRTFPQWHFLPYPAYYAERAIAHLYFASHRSGPLETLYKAGLSNIAFILDKIPLYNIVGTTPEDIIGHGLPLKLLRILDQEFLEHRLFSEREMERCREVYTRYAGYLGQELPNIYQWYYLEELYDGGNEFAELGFNRIIYDQLGRALLDETIDNYREFLWLKKKLPMIDVAIPRVEDVEGTNGRLEAMYDLINSDDKVDEMIRVRKEMAFYEYADETFIVVMPKDIKEIYKEALNQRNCLMSFARRHACGETTIAYVRKVSDPKKSHVTIEIRDWKIVQAYGKHNRFPEKEVFIFLEKYARDMWLMFDPLDIVRDVNNVMNRDLQQFLKRKAKKTWEKAAFTTERQSFRQLTLQEFMKPLLEVRVSRLP